MTNTAFALPMTQHALDRSSSRRLPYDAVEAALVWGREVHTRGAHIHALGKRDVARAYSAGVDVRRWEGVHVVCHASGVVLTCYRNRDLSGLRARRGSRS